MNKVGIRLFLLVAFAILFEQPLATSDSTHEQKPITKHATYAQGEIWISQTANQVLRVVGGSGSGEWRVKSLSSDVCGNVRFLQPQQGNFFLHLDSKFISFDTYDAGQCKLLVQKLQDKKYKLAESEITLVVTSGTVASNQVFSMKTKAPWRLMVEGGERLEPKLPFLTDIEWKIGNTSLNFDNSKIQRLPIEVGSDGTLMWSYGAGFCTFSSDGIVEVSDKTEPEVPTNCRLFFHLSNLVVIDAILYAPSNRFLVSEIQVLKKEVNGSYRANAKNAREKTAGSFKSVKVSQNKSKLVFVVDFWKPLELWQDIQILWCLREDLVKFSEGDPVCMESKAPQENTVWFYPAQSKHGITWDLPKGKATSQGSQKGLRRVYEINGDFTGYRIGWVSIATTFEGKPYRIRRWKCSGFLDVTCVKVRDAITTDSIVWERVNLLLR